MSGDGSIFRRTRKGANGRPLVRWVAKVSIGPRGAQVVTTRVCRTRKEAADVLAELLAPPHERSQEPLGVYLRTWLRETAGPSIAPNTRRGYEDVIEHLAPIADILLADLTSEDIEWCLNRMEARHAHQKKARPAAPKTRRNALIMLRRALSVAEQRGYIPRNVAKAVPLPKVAQMHEPAMTEDRARAILAAVSGDRYEAAYVLALFGLRASEVLGLAWSDVEPGMVHVRRQLVGSGPSARRAAPKSTAGIRDVPVLPFVDALLEQHHQRQRQERIASGVSTEDGLVFVTPAGYAVNGSWFTKHFQALLAAAGIPKLRVHALRHGFASLLAGQDVHPSVAQALVGHANASTTLQVYTSVSQAQLREAVDRLDHVLGTPTGTPTKRAQGRS
jgi:integrase